MLGGGGYAIQLLSYCIANNISLPTYVFLPQPATMHFKGIICRPESELTYAELDIVVIGSATYQYEILTRVNQWVPESVSVIDCSPFVLDSDNARYYATEYDLLNTEAPYCLFFDFNPAEHIKVWFQTYINKLAERGIKVLTLHPLHEVQQSLLKGAQDIYLWNGSRSEFYFLNAKLASLGIKPKFVECGFFPQRQYFYIDEVGINANRYLADDDLSWVNEKHLEQLSAIRNKFFNNIRPAHEYYDYIFVPLQMPNDSNVQNHSRFKKGMQEFIDFIESQYPHQDIVFKRHPKDINQYTSRVGKFSDADSRALILAANIIHGINSTVLFEAALAGKTVIAEGDCLLKQHKNNIHHLIAAVIAKQQKVSHWDK